MRNSSTANQPSLTRISYSQATRLLIQKGRRRGRRLEGKGVSGYRGRGNAWPCDSGPARWGRCEPGPGGQRLEPADRHSASGGPLVPARCLWCAAARPGPAVPPARASKVSGAGAGLGEGPYGSIFVLPEGCFGSDFLPPCGLASPRAPGRMTRDRHVRICEGRGARIPSATGRGFPVIVDTGCYATAASVVDRCS